MTMKLMKQKAQEPIDPRKGHLYRLALKVRQAFGGGGAKEHPGSPPMDEPIIEAKRSVEEANRKPQGKPFRFRLRQEPRVEADLYAQVHVGGRLKPARVSNLSAGGAFLETARPSMCGARLVLSIELPEGAVRTEAQVVYANVPGNLQRPGLPLGMGVRFLALDGEAEARVRNYIGARLQSSEA